MITETLTYYYKAGGALPGIMFEHARGPANIQCRHGIIKIEGKPHLIFEIITLYRLRDATQFFSLDT